MSPAHDQAARACPTEADLRNFLSGRGAWTEVESRSLTDHLSGCSRCTAQMDGLSFDSRVIDALRVMSKSDAPSTAEFAEVAKQVIQMSHESMSSALPSRFGAGTRDFVSPFALPGTLGPYRIVELLSSGGMGVVYRAEDTRLRRHVALKMLRPSVARDADFRERFLKEAQTLAAVKHDNIVTIHQVDQATTPSNELVPFLAMELLEGESLKDWMSANPRPPAEWVIRIGRQAAAGLAAAHARNFIHRDVKPGNLWLEAPSGWMDEPVDQRPPLGAVGRLKLIDFGLARPGDDNVTRSVSGTPAYMAPEQARGDRIDVRTDLYGLGCVLYELCTGTMPFAGLRFPWVGNEPAAPRPVLLMNPQTPALLASLVERMLQPDPAARPASARKVEEELAALDSGVNGANTVNQQRADTVRVVEPPGRSTRRINLGVAAGALLALGVAIFLSVRSLNHPQSQTPPDADQNATSVEDPWTQLLAAETPKEQFTLVTNKLCELNPGLRVNDVSGWVEPELVVRIVVRSPNIKDISPIRGLPDVKMVGVSGKLPGSGVFTDISPLAGMRLGIVRVAHQPMFKDMSPLKDQALLILQLPGTGVETLEDINGKLLDELDISSTKVRDLSPLRLFLNLKDLDCTGCPIESLEPLADTSIRELKADIRSDKDREVLRKMPLLKRINDKPVAEFLANP